MALLQNCTFRKHGYRVQEPDKLQRPGLERAGIYNAGNLVISLHHRIECRVDGSVSFGGGIWNAGNAQITNSIVVENTGGGSPDAVVI
jgi:hypothetical protein